MALPFIIGILFIVIFVAVAASSKATQRQRIEGWQSAAKRLGYELREDDTVVHHSLNQFKVFSRGSSKKSESLVRMSRDDVELTIANYQFTVSSGDSSSTYRYTICVMQSDDIFLPHFYLRPQKSLSDFFGKMFGGQDFDFQDDPRFSNRFVLQGEHEAAVRALFSPAIRSAFLQCREDANVEGFEDTLIYHTAKAIDASNLSSLVDEGMRLLKPFIEQRRSAIRT